jgi:flagellar biosynthesis protein FlhF
MHQLAELLTVARPDEVHLVLSATAGPRTLQAAAERFAEARADRLILTKLDEADALGGLLELVSRVNLPISYLTTGQTVPDDLEAAERERLAGLIIGTLAISVTQPHAPTPARVPNATVRSAANRSVTPPARKL